MREAVHVCGAHRVGHATRLIEDSSLTDYCNDRRIPLEICLTSNVQTRVADSYATHPFREYFHRGLNVVLNTDNRLMSGITLTDEYVHAARSLDFTFDELAEVAMNGFESASSRTRSASRWWRAPATRSSRCGRSLDMTHTSSYGARGARTDAANEIRRRIGADPPALGHHPRLGTRWARRDASSRRAMVPFAEVPGFPTATVVGHAGRSSPDRSRAGVSSRSPAASTCTRATTPRSRVSRCACCTRWARVTLFVSNAAGGIRASFTPGDLMLITDHLNLMFRNPLIGAVEPGDERFPDMSEPYDRGLRVSSREHARALGFALQEGVYCGLLGPTYETPAEVRMLTRLGADAVGMSTVPEVIVARAIGMRVAGVSCITNLASGISPHPLSHAEVIETTSMVAARFEALVERFVAQL